MRTRKERSKWRERAVFIRRDGRGRVLALGDVVARVADSAAGLADALRVDEAAGVAVVPALVDVLTARDGEGALILANSLGN